MTEKETLKEVNEAIVETPVNVSFDILPRNWIHRLLQRMKLRPIKATYQVKPMTLGTRARYSKYALDLDITEYDGNATAIYVTNKMTADKTDAIVGCLATVLHGRDSEPPKQLVRLIRENVRQDHLDIIVPIIIDGLKTKSFLRSITLISGVSLQAEEIIAPAE